MDIITRFDPAKAQKAHSGTILASTVLPEGLTSPFDHAWGYLNGPGAMEPHTHHKEEVYIGVQPRAGRGRQSEHRAERLHNFQVLHGDGNLRHLLNIAGWLFEDRAVLRQEFLGLAPPRIRLTVPGEGIHVVLGQHTHPFTRRCIHEREEQLLSVASCG